MRVIIAGTRMHRVEPENLVDLIKTSGYDITELVCGMATGVDLSAKAWAEQNGIPVEKFHPEWGRYGKVAGHLRNKAMAEYADALIAIWDGESKGTANMIETMKSMGKHSTIFRYQ